jgi:hypothetical protein
MIRGAIKYDGLANCRALARRVMLWWVRHITSRRVDVDDAKPEMSHIQRTSALARHRRVGRIMRSIVD